MKNINIKSYDWFLLIMEIILGVVVLVCHVSTAYGQEVYKVSKTTVIVNNDKSHAKQDTIKTQYKVVIDNVIHPVYLNPKSGSMFIVRTSRKTGKSYRCYSIKGTKIKDLFQHEK